MTGQPLIPSGADKVISLAGETQFAENGVVSRTLLRAGATRWVLFGFSAGQELTEHTTTQHAVVQILTGECEFTVAGKVHKLKAGDFLYMTPSCVHAVKAATQFSMLLTLSQDAPGRFVPGPAS